MVGAKKVVPIRGSSLFLELIMGSEGPPAATIKKAPDLCCHTRMKHWLAKNNGHTGELKVTLIYILNLFIVDFFLLRNTFNFWATKGATVLSV